MELNTDYLQRSLATLERSFALLQSLPNKPGDSASLRDVYRAAVVKGFELTLEVVGKLLRRALKAYGAHAREIDALFYKDLFRQAALRGLMTPEAVERWFAYRDNRNNTAHDYGEDFAETTLALIPAFLQDARAFEVALRERDFHGRS